MADILDKNEIAIRPVPARTKGKLGRAWTFFLKRVIGFEPSVLP